MFYRNTKHITIWFQNKRQITRKAIQHGTVEHTEHQHPLPPPAVSQPQPPSQLLDYIASAHQLRRDLSVTPKRKLWDPNTVPSDNMPSSPLEPQTAVNRQDLLRDEAYIAFGKEHVVVRRMHSLEWACATARVGSKESNRYEAVLSILGHKEQTSYNMR